MSLPKLSAYDPDTKGEGSIDPLGLYGIADALGVMLVPAVRERQSVPRFLTATAVSLWVCREFDDDQVAVDEVSEPWQVFEWYTVEGLVRVLKNDGDALAGTPGREKTAAAIRDRQPLCAERYLKTPTVFGFHGVYRILARALDIDISGRLGSFGYELLDTWAAERGIRGFVHGNGAPGASDLQSLQDAVAEGLKKGATARSDAWSGWRFLADNLAPHRIGRREAELLRSALLSSPTGFRREVLEFLISKRGQEVWQRAQAEDYPSERTFHAELFRQASPPLRELLDAIRAFEAFSRLLINAFEGCLAEMTRIPAKVGRDTLAGIKAVAKAAQTVPKSFAETHARLAPFPDLARRFELQFATVSERASTSDWVHGLLEHHRQNQRRKPPAGKAPWIEYFDDGRHMVRPQYRLEPRPPLRDQYVHFYRTRPLWSFARDVGWLS